VTCFLPIPAHKVVHEIDPAALTALHEKLDAAKAKAKK
jgi:hypothetical protein